MIQRIVQIFSAIFRATSNSFGSAGIFGAGGSTGNSSVMFGRNDGISGN
jgi:hypothetical protein